MNSLVLVASLALICVATAKISYNKLDALNRLSQGLPVEDPDLQRRMKQGVYRPQMPTFKSGDNFPDADPESLKVLLGVKGNNRFLPIQEPKDISDMDLPASFDARAQWPNCKSIQKIRDQGCCGDCWAVGAVESMSDRVCIHTNAAHTPSISAEDLMSCCSWCGDNPQNQTAGGCNGVYNLDYAWEYWITTGLVTGGGYDSDQGCLPYEIPFTPAGGCASSAQTPACVEKCESGYPKSWNQDLIYGLSAYGVAQQTKAIQGEILINGPVEAAFLVYYDFFNYTNGVYQHTSGQLAGGHAIRILGWGVENNLPYWLCANSWGTSWGELGGYFKILRGVNECGIEENVVTGLPDLARSFRKP